MVKVAIEIGNMNVIDYKDFIEVSNRVIFYFRSKG